MGERIFASVVHGRAFCHVVFVFLQPAFNGALLLLHLAFHKGYVATVGYNVLPVFRKGFGCLNILGIDHQPGSVAVEPVHNVRSAFLVGHFQVGVQYAFYVEGVVGGWCRKYPRAFFNYNDVMVFVNNSYEFAVDAPGMFLAAYLNSHARCELVVVSRCGVFVYHDSSVSQNGLCLCAADPVKGVFNEWHKLLILLYGKRQIF